jgi:hypothetical protein
MKLNSVIGRTLIIPCLVLMESCHQGLTKAEQDAISISATQMLRDYHADVRRAGLTAEFNYLDSSADFFWLPPGYRSPVTYKQVSEFLRKAAPVYRSVSNSWDSLRVIPYTQDLAGYTGRMRSVMTDTSGKSTELILIETGLLVKRKSGWKLLNGQTSILE